jgi:hypothetical protein
MVFPRSCYGERVIQLVTEIRNRSILREGVLKDCVASYIYHLFILESFTAIWYTIKLFEYTLVSAFSGHVPSFVLKITLYRLEFVFFFLSLLSYYLEGFILISRDIVECHIFRKSLMRLFSTDCIERR